MVVRNKNTADPHTNLTSLLYTLLCRYTFDDFKKQKQTYAHNIVKLMDFSVLQSAFPSEPKNGFSSGQKEEWRFCSIILFQVRHCSLLLINTVYYTTSEN